MSGVAYNLAKALKTLGDDVRFVSMMGDDFSAKYIREELANIDISTEHVKNNLKATPSSAVLYDDTGKRQIYCDLKDAQEATLDCGKELYEDCDIIILGRGDKGALMYVKSEARFYELPAVAVGNVVNTVGAGDALCSSFVHYYAKGLKADEALMRAQIFASYKIGFDGASVGFATEEKVEELWENFY